MILAIERTKFTYLYKYNQIRVDVNQLIDKSTDALKGMLTNDLNRLIELFDKAMPLFEQDHEIILLEIEKSKMSIQNGILISFDSIQCIYPLTDIGLKLLDGKISEDFILEQPVFENVIEAIKINRSMDFRKAAAAKLLEHYDLVQYIKKDTILSIESSVEKNLLDKVKPQIFDTFLDHLIAYNKTPSYIPEGNIEHICKIGVIAIKYLGKAEEVFTNGHFYKSSIKYKSKINSPSYLKSYSDFNSIVDVELKSSIEKMVDIISKEYSGVDVFKVSYFFLAFKSFLNKHDNNVELLNNEIEDLIYDDKQSAAIVLAMLGFTYSIESIYEGLHRISNAPLLKSTRSKLNAEVENRKRVESAIEKQKQQEKELENERISMEIQSHSSVNELQSSSTPNISENKIEEIEIGKTIELTLFEESEIETANGLIEKESNSSINNESENIFENDGDSSVSEPSVIYKNSDNYESDNHIDKNKDVESQDSDVVIENKQENSEDINLESSGYKAVETKNEEINNSVQIENPKIGKPKSTKTKGRKIIVQEVISSASEIKSNQEDSKSQTIDNSPDQSKQEKTKSITVQIFENEFLEKFLLEAYSINKSKYDLWLELMNNFFPDKNEIISVKKIMNQFKIKKYSQNNMFDSKDEINLLHDFFKTYNQ